MRAFGAIGVIGGVAVGAKNFAARCIWRNQARYIAVCTLRFHRMKRWIGRVKLQPGVELTDLPCDRQHGYHIVIRMALEADLILKLRDRHVLPAGGDPLDPFSGAGDVGRARR